MSLKKISRFFLAVIVAIFLFTGCKMQNTGQETGLKNESNEAAAQVKYDGVATFAGGCFWCMEPAFENLDGVGDVISGYAGGTEEEATYKKVSSGKTGHREAVQVPYDPKTVSYEMLVETFFHQIDPTDDGGQFVDRGPQYRTAIFYHDEEQKKVAEQAVADLTASKKFEKPIVTAILPYTTFFPAEEYHQDFYKKSSDYYKRYKDGSGRTDFISDNWAKEEALKYSRENETGSEDCESYKCFKKPTEEELKKTLTKIQYNVTQEEGTEKPFDNAYWDNEAEGIYVDIVSGEPLFSSTDKFDSGTGWPSFTKPLSPDLVTLKKDGQLFYERTEVRSKLADSHLGHVFDDGPKELGGKRWCMNSAALKFIPKAELTGNYAEFKRFFPE